MLTRSLCLVVLLSCVLALGCSEPARDRAAPGSADSTADNRSSTGIDSTDQDSSSTQDESQASSTATANGGMNVLPGASGPLFEIVGELQPGIAITGADVAVNNVNPAEPPASRTLPSGCTELSIAVSFESTPEFESIGIAIYDAMGEFAGLSDGAVISDQNYATGSFTVEFFRRAEEIIPDGAYQARLMIDGEVVLHVNWQVGDLDVTDSENTSP